MPERKQGWYYRAARVGSQDKKGGDSLRGRSRKGAQEEDAEPWSADTAEDTVSPGSTMLAGSLSSSEGLREYLRQSLSGNQRKRKGISKCQSEPNWTVQHTFTEHLLNTHWDRKMNEIMPSAATRTDLAMVILRAVKSDREWQILYDITYGWTLKKWCKWTYLQKRNRLTGNKLIVTKEEGHGGIKQGRA